MNLTERIDNDIKEALKSNEVDRLSTLRLLKNNLLAAAKAKQAELVEAEVIGIIQKDIKQHRESAAAYRQGNRPESALKAEAEIKTLETYLPSQLDSAELTKQVDEVIAKCGATNLSDMGKVMAELKERLGGRADMGQVSALVRDRLVK